MPSIISDKAAFAGITLGDDVLKVPLRSFSVDTTSFCGLSPGPLLGSPETLRFDFKGVATLGTAWRDPLADVPKDVIRRAVLRALLTRNHNRLPVGVASDSPGEDRWHRTLVSRWHRRTSRKAKARR